MILKVVKSREIEKNKEKEITILTEYYESKKFNFIDGFAYTDKNELIDITDYSQKDDITDNFVEYKVLETYLMNNDGKTIERIR